LWEDFTMGRWTLGLVVAVLAAATARAHFIWIVPEASKPAAKVVFSDSLEPDRPEFLEKITQMEMFVRGPDGKAVPLRWTKGDDALLVTVAGKGPQIVGGVCKYGIFARGNAEPSLLMYYPKALVGGTLGDGTAALEEACAGLPLEIVRVKGQPEGVFEVRWQGKAVAEAEVVVMAPGKQKHDELKADKDGRFTIPESKPGLYGIRALHTEKTAGEHDGKKYKGVRHYATLVVRRGEGAAPTKQPAAEADQAATKLLADARAARAQWTNFPGFTAELEINVDGQVTRGTVQVQPEGKVTVQTPDADAGQWALRQLRQIVSHRIDNSASLGTPCAFVDQDTTHPLGRAIRVLNDELHSSYRIRDRQITVVNRQMQDIRFTIVVTENRLNEEQRYLPAHFVVNTWDVATGALKSSETNHETWQRVGHFDLPATARTVTATAGKLETRTLTLSKHKLMDASNSKER
jgi:uncharacterized GH25 family protein